MTEEEIDQSLTGYFKTHETLTRSQFEVLCTQVKSTAHRILQKLVKDGKLRPKGDCPWRADAAA